MSRVAKLLLQFSLGSVVLLGATVQAQSDSSGKTNKVTTTTKAEATTKVDSLAVGSKWYDAVKELARMSKRYSLTEEQKAKIQPILLEQQKQVHALGEDTSLSDRAWNIAVKKAHEQTVSKVKLELTDVQLSKYVKDEAKRAKQDKTEDAEDDGPPPDGPPPGGPGGGGPGGGGPPPGM